MKLEINHEDWTWNDYNGAYRLARYTTKSPTRKQRLLATFTVDYAGKVNETFRCEMCGCRELMRNSESTIYCPSCDDSFLNCPSTPTVETEIIK